MGRTPDAPGGGAGRHPIPARVHRDLPVAHSVLVEVVDGALSWFMRDAAP
jgi:hypothetical protein